MEKCITCGRKLIDENSAFCSTNCFFKLWKKTASQKFSLGLSDNEPWI